MNKEELIGKLQMVYVGDKNALNELIGYYDGLKQVIEELQQENKQLKDNWNKLREYIGAEWYSYDNESVECEVAGDILDKMQELEGSDSNE